MDEDIAGTFARASELADRKDGLIYHVTTGQETVSHTGDVVSVLECDTCWRRIRFTMEARLRPFIREELKALLPELVRDEMREAFL